jgi:hypothetical protein
MTTDIHALVGAYALDAVDDVERAAFERHVTECESCRVELAELRETAARLADNAWSVPPPSMRSSVMAKIGNTRQLTPIAPARAPRRSGPTRWLAAAAVAAVLAGGGVFAVQEQRVRDRDAVAAAAEQREARMRQILDAPDMVVRTAPITGGGKVTVASSRASGAGVILMGADAAPAGGKVYQMWTIRGAAPSSAGVMLPGQTSSVLIVDGLPGWDAVGITTEPAGGSVTPTSPPVSTVSLA